VKASNRKTYFECAANEQGVTLAGLQFLFQLFIQRNRPESSWQVLRKFGYNERLELVLNTPETSIPNLFPDQGVELTKKTIEFLTKVRCCSLHRAYAKRLFFSWLTCKIAFSRAADFPTI